MSNEPSIKNESAPNWRIKAWFPDLGDSSLKMLKIYFLELIKFNKTINLISSKTIINADAIHFADSIFSSKIVSKVINKNSQLYDLGSGNGFPGMVFAILNQDQEVVLVDSDERKCEFLKHVVATLSLKNASVKNCKIENLASDSVFQAVCRGFSPLPKALLTLRKIVSSNGQIYHLKSEEWAVEVSQIPTQLCSIWQPSLLADYVLPVNNAKMFVVKTTKIE